MTRTKRVAFVDSICALSFARNTRVRGLNVNASFAHGEKLFCLFLLIIVVVGMGFKGRK